MPNSENSVELHYVPNLSQGVAVLSDCLIDLLVSPPPVSLGVLKQCFEDLMLSCNHPLVNISFWIEVGLKLLLFDIRRESEYNFADMQLINARYRYIMGRSDD